MSKVANFEKDLGYFNYCKEIKSEFRPCCTIDGTILEIERCSDHGVRIMVIFEWPVSHRLWTMESDSSIASWSSWELMDYELSRIYIYEKEYRDYVVYFSANGDSPSSSTLRSFEYSSLESSGTIRSRSFSLSLPLFRLWTRSIVDRSFKTERRGTKLWITIEANWPNRMSLKRLVSTEN